MLELGFIGVGVLLVVLAWRLHETLMRALDPGRYPARLAQYPSITIIRPIKGLDSEAEQNIRAGLDTGYPGAVETIFVFDDEDEPALPIVRKILSEPGRPGGEAQVLFCGQPPPNRTGKLNAMLAGLDKAQGELIAFADSDVRSDPEALRVMAETLINTPEAGSAFARVAVVGGETAGDAGLAFMLNSLYTPMSALMASKTGGELPFILGQYMIFQREILDEAVNLRSMTGQFVDDLYMGQLITDAGLRNVISPHPIELVHSGLTPRQAWDTYCRWLTFSRSGMPGWSYKMPLVIRAALYLVSLLTGVGALLAGAPVAALPYLCAAAVVDYSFKASNRRTGGTPFGIRHSWVPAAFMLLLPSLFARAYTQTKVNWRGRDYELSGQARLSANLD